ncbi:MAG: 16S rRNA (uracil(1498)-N(3))-methyltransferase [Oscillospiraceae bacterium]|nr:16S rRNA (uracil(1498)-N(3))-methyltransferase [Oscillospiraceae bacterium]
MPRYFIGEDAIDGDIITVTGADAVHMGRSLRMREGDAVTFCRQGTEYSCIAERFTSDSVICRIVESFPSMAEPRLRLTVYQAYPKADKAELIIQKCTELGAAAFVFFPSRRCVSKPNDNKAVRWQRIAEEAAKQSGRGIVPEVRTLPSFEAAVTELTSADLPLFCYENGGERLSEQSYDIGTAGIMIGSEGGFDRDEADMARDMGAKHIWLGRRILRCETAPIAVTAVIMDRAGEI